MRGYRSTGINTEGGHETNEPNAGQLKMDDELSPEQLALNVALSEAVRDGQEARASELLDKGASKQRSRNTGIAKPRAPAGTGTRRARVANG